MTFFARIFRYRVLDFGGVLECFVAPAGGEPHGGACSEQTTHPGCAERCCDAEAGTRPSLRDASGRRVGGCACGRAEKSSISVRKSAAKSLRGRRRNLPRTRDTEELEKKLGPVAAANDFKQAKRKGPKLMATVAKPPVPTRPAGAPPMVPRIAPREDLNPFRIAQIQFDMAAEVLEARSRIAASAAHAEKNPGSFSADQDGQRADKGDDWISRAAQHCARAGQRRNPVSPQCDAG